MLKRIMVALAGLFLMLGLAAAPANGTAVLDGTVELSEEADGSGTREVVPESAIPSGCASIPAGLSAVRFVNNRTSNPGTSVSFYEEDSCTTLLATVDPSKSIGDINSPDGAGFWQVTPME